MGQKIGKLKDAVGKNSIETIELEKSNKIKDVHILELLDSIYLHKNKSVKSFIINNPIPEELSDKMVNIFKNLTTDNINDREQSSLSVVFNQYDVGSQSLVSLFNSLQENDIVYDLQLTGTFKPFNQKALSALQDLLCNENKTTLESLTIGGFAISEKLTQEFIGIIVQQKKLKKLRLDRWELEIKGIELLFNTENLEELSITNCGINDDFLVEIASFLPVNRSIRKVDLSGNSITDNGVKKLLVELRKHKDITVFQIKLENNPIENQVFVETVDKVLDAYKTFNQSKLVKNKDDNNLSKSQNKQILS